jgi:hypothetical protein
MPVTQLMKVTANDKYSIQVLKTALTATSLLSKKPTKNLTKDPSILNKPLKLFFKNIFSVYSYSTPWSIETLN